MHTNTDARGTLGTQAEAVALKMPLRLWAALRGAVQKPLATLRVEGPDSESMALTNLGSMPAAASTMSASSEQDTAVDLQPGDLTQLAGGYLLRAGPRSAALSLIQALMPLHSSSTLHHWHPYAAYRHKVDNLSHHLYHAEAVVAATADLDADIMKRRAPVMRRAGRPNLYEANVTGRRRQKPYALKARPFISSL